MLRRNFAIKAGALLFAIFLWFWVMFSEENPLAQKTVEAPLALAGVPDGTVAFLETEKVRLTVRGLEQDLAGLAGLQAQVNCRGYRSGQHRITVKALVPEDVSLVTIRPSQVMVRLEEIITKRLPVEIKLIGELLGGLPVQQVQQSPQAVKLSGAESQLAKVTRVRARADLSRLTPGAPVTVPLQALDRTGQRVSGVVLSPARVKLTVLTERALVPKVVPVLLQTQGALPAGITLESVQLEPPMVTVVFPAEQREAEVLTGIKTEILNLTTIQKNTVKDLRLLVPEGFHLTQEPRVRVTIRVKVEGEAVEGE
jgi:YbbR domain-containing protein